MKTNKDRFMEYANLRLKIKRYDKRIQKLNILDCQIRGMEKTRRRKIGQI